MTVAALLVVVGFAFCWGIAEALPISIGYWDHMDPEYEQATDQSSWFRSNTGPGSESGSGFAPMAKRFSMNFNDFKDSDGKQKKSSEEQIRFSIRNFIFVCICCVQTTIAPHFLFTLLKADKITLCVESLQGQGDCRCGCQL